MTTLAPPSPYIYGEPGAPHIYRGEGIFKLGFDTKIDDFRQMGLNFKDYPPRGGSRHRKGLRWSPATKGGVA